jgi:hypothetical protein
LTGGSYNGSNASRLPPGSDPFRSPSVWEQYRWYIIGHRHYQFQPRSRSALQQARRRRQASFVSRNLELHYADELGLWAHRLGAGDLD